MSAETIELLVGAEALRSLGVGVVFAAIAGGLGYWWMQTRTGAAPVAGIALVLAFLVALPAAQRVGVTTIVGILAVAAAGLLPGDRVLRALAVVPGAVVLAVGLPEEVGLGLRVLVALAVPIAGALVAESDQRYAARALATPLFSIASVGVFFAVPDTEHAIVLLMVSAPFVFLSSPRPLAALGPSGAFAVVALLMWVLAMDAFSRPLTAVGASTALGLLLAEPVVARWFGPASPSLTSNVLLVWVSQLVIAYFASRIAAPRDPVVVALIVSGVSLLLAGGLSYALSRPELDPARSRGG
jgi:hypothetical protein